MNDTVRSCGYAASLILILLAFGNSLAQAAPAAQLIPFWDQREHSSIIVIDHSPWQNFLNKYLDDQHSSGINRLDYAAVTQEDKNHLHAYLEYLQSLDPRQLNSLEQKAFWINLYNGMTVSLILHENNRLKSIRQIRSGLFTAGPWQRKTLRLANQALSLDDIEHGILRPIWQDNRIHYAVNCASLGCPNLLKTAFTGSNLELLLEAAASDYINHPRAVRVNQNKLVLSSIYDWYRADFGDDFAGLIEHLSSHAKPQLAAKLKSFTGAEYSYDWALNKP